MKTLYILFITSLFSTSIMAQCDKLFDFKEGTSWTWSNYDKKGKLLGKTIQKVDKLSIDGANRIASLKVVSSDNKGEQTEPVTMEMACRDGVIYVDMKKFVPREQLEDDELEMSIDATDLEMPGELNVGDQLKDASIKMNLSGDSPMAMFHAINESARWTPASAVDR